MEMTLRSDAPLPSTDRATEATLLRLLVLPGQVVQPHALAIATILEL